MSSHYLYLTCKEPGCDATENIYMGDVLTFTFPDSGPYSFEGETLAVWCNDHIPEGATS